MQAQTLINQKAIETPGERSLVEVIVISGKPVRVSQNQSLFRLQTIQYKPESHCREVENEKHLDKQNDNVLAVTNPAGAVTNRVDCTKSRIVINHNPLNVGL